VKSASATEIRSHFGAFLDRSRFDPVAIQRAGRPVAVLLSWQEYERLTALEGPIGDSRQPPRRRKIVLVPRRLWY
jgi:prevent-host-death family protein